MKYEMTLRENIAISDWKHLDDTDKIQELLKQMDLPEFSSKEALDMLLGSEFDGRDWTMAETGNCPRHVQRKQYDCSG